MPGIRWINLFLDVPADLIEETATFWASALDATLSPWRGDGHEFISILPRNGSPWLGLHAVDDERFGAHPTFVVDDMEAFREHALSLAAEHVQDRAGVAVFRSPGGVPFCFTDQGPKSARQDRSTDQLADQISFDLSHHDFDAEMQFWSTLTGWPERPSSRHREFEALERPAGIPVRITFQRTHHSEPGGHLDVFSPRRMEAVAKHKKLGAHEFAKNEWWTVMVTPWGQQYCIADSDGRRDTDQEADAHLDAAPPQ